MLRRIFKGFQGSSIKHKEIIHMLKIIVKISKNVSNINKMVQHDCNFVNYYYHSRSLSNETRII